MSVSILLEVFFLVLPCGLVRHVIVWMCRTRAATKLLASCYKRNKEKVSFVTSFRGPLFQGSPARTHNNQSADV